MATMPEKIAVHSSMVISLFISNPPQKIINAIVASRTLVIKRSDKRNDPDFPAAAHLLMTTHITNIIGNEKKAPKQTPIITRSATA